MSDVGSDQDTMVSLIRFQRQLFPRLDHFLLQLLDLFGEHGLGRGGRVDTRGLDGDDDVTVVLQEVVGVQADDTGLIRLGDIGEDDVDHGDEHSVFRGMTGVFDDGCEVLGYCSTTTLRLRTNNVRPLLGHVDQITSTSVREFDGVDSSLGTDNIGNVGN